MDLTIWLDYFVAEPKSQIVEVKKLEEQVIRRDLSVQAQATRHGAMHFHSYGI
jgi:hypothetical protein